MTQQGFFLIGIRKTVTLYLWGETREYLESALNESGKKANRQIVPYYKEGNKGYLEIDGQLLRVQ